eukprot:CAMPEP_0119554424 /NCGR_PEP_ID=MMETSP1352-20130426/6911_1 /TAXON_ID=265584 /ORGANISM="Stauroneis constricta, Strain CCMP1120" /LENGTH=136 /DNA_ID=CAMNT_0007601011 /DNA_START=193 /DNA_END=604 /DNA_ORIENTATION=+
MISVIRTCLLLLLLATQSSSHFQKQQQPTATFMSQCTMMKKKTTTTTATSRRRGKKQIKGHDKHNDNDDERMIMPFVKPEVRLLQAVEEAQKRIQLKEAVRCAGDDEDDDDGDDDDDGRDKTNRRNECQYDSVTQF